MSSKVRGALPGDIFAFVVPSPRYTPPPGSTESRVLATTGHSAIALGDIQLQVKDVTGSHPVLLTRGGRDVRPDVIYANESLVVPGTEANLQAFENKELRESLYSWVFAHKNRDVALDILRRINAPSDITLDSAVAPVHVLHLRDTP